MTCVDNKVNETSAEQGGQLGGQWQRLQMIVAYTWLSCRDDEKQSYSRYILKLEPIGIRFLEGMNIILEGVRVKTMKFLFKKFIFE